MIQWITYWGWALGWRIAVTLMCAYTFQNLISQEGYSIPWSTVGAAMCCAVVLIIVWASIPKKNWNIDS